MRALGTGSTWTHLIPGLLLTGFGIGIVNPAIAKIGLGVVEPQRSGMASGISNTFRIGGLATGVAALGAVFQHQLTNELSAHSGLGVPASALAKTIASGGTRAAVASDPHDPGIAAVSHHAFVSGMNDLLAIGAIAVFLGAVCGVALVRRRDFHAVWSGSRLRSRLALMPAERAPVAAHAAVVPRAQRHRLSRSPRGGRRRSPPDLVRAARARPPARGRAPGRRDRAWRPGRLSGAEHGRAARGPLRRARGRRGAGGDQHPADPGRDRLHPRPLRCAHAGRRPHAGPPRRRRARSSGSSSAATAASTRSSWRRPARASRRTGSSPRTTRSASTTRAGRPAGRRA